MTNLDFIPNLGLSPIFSVQTWERDCSPRWRKALEELKRADLWLGLGGMVGLASTMTTTGQHQTALRSRACLFVAPGAVRRLSPSCPMQL